jgi:hypothetical protein
MTRACAAAAALLTAAVALAYTPARAAEPTRTVLLRSTAVPLDARSPLTADVAAAPDVLPGGSRVSAMQIVTVVVDQFGTPQRIGVRQRLVLEGTGDYSFVVPAPLVDVVGAPGSDAVPGRRSAGIVWQGFVSKRRVLAADATLRPRRVAAALPIKLRLTTTVDGSPLEPGERRSGRLRVRLELRNDASLPVQGFDAPAVPARVAPVLDEIRNAAAGGAVVPDRYLSVQGEPRAHSVIVDAPFAVAGRLRVPASTLENIVVRGGTVTRAARATSVRFRSMLGEGRPSAVISLEADGSTIGSPSVALTARPVHTVPGLTPVGSRSWREAVARGRARDGRELVGLASRAVLQLARVQQFEELLSVPGRSESSTEYRFRSEAATGIQERPSAPPDDGSGPMRAALWFLGAVALACGGAALWARL